MSTDPEANSTNIFDKYNIYKDVMNEYSKCIKRSKKPLGKLSLPKVKIYMHWIKWSLKNSWIEGCNTGLETNNALMNAYLPGSTPIYNTNQSDINETSDSAQNSWSVLVQNDIPIH